MIHNLGTARNLLLIFIAMNLNIHAEEFAIHRGINISHFLSQSPKRGEQRASYIQQEDIQFIKAQGFDHVRLPVDEEHLWNKNGEKESGAFQLLHQTLVWCQEVELKVIVDLHTLRSHHFNAAQDGKKNTLFHDEKAVMQFAGFWKDLSQELKKYPLDFLAYEILNEPVADDSEDWNRVVNRVLQEVRKNEAERWIVIGANRWQSVSRVDELVLPEEDRRIILSFHFYIPMVLTHYRAPWSHIGDYDGPVQYPGIVVTKDDAEQFRAKPGYKDFWMGDDGKTYNREILASKLEDAIAFSKKTGRPLYCGEFGCYRQSPKPDHLRWTRDFVSILDEHKIPWTKWDYKGGFSIRNPETGNVDSDLKDALFQVPPQK
ncbi:cellulase family glycosylhydrolase [Kiritimatiellaeota bacterium B1221]|nr:cellulase family glycosylhydrolase [Kiritimatiellaeota bacterium B1221]